MSVFFFQAEDGIRYLVRSRGLGDVYKRQAKKRNGAVPAEARLFEKTIYWLKEMNLADGLSIRALGKSARYELLIESHGQASNLKAVSYTHLTLPTSDLV